MAYNSFFANPPASSSNANPNTGGLFGLSNTTQSNTTTPSLFGNTNPAPNPLPNNANTNAGGIFGLGANTNTNTSNQQQQGTTGTTGNPLFTNQQSQQQPLSNLFSSTTSNPLFSGNKTATGSPFGGSMLGTSTLGTNVLGGQQGGGSLLSSRPNTLTSTTGVGTGITQLEAHEQFLKISQGVETIYQAWNPATKNCRFQVGVFLVSFSLFDVSFIVRFLQPCGP
jgi:nuclear pore complex protein Nup54